MDEITSALLKLKEIVDAHTKETVETTTKKAKRTRVTKVSKKKEPPLKRPVLVRSRFDKDEDTGVEAPVAIQGKTDLLLSKFPKQRYNN